MNFDNDGVLIRTCVCQFLKHLLQLQFWFTQVTHVLQETRLAIAKAVTYLDGVLLEHHRAHTAAIIAYALALADSPSKIRANAMLTDLAKYEEGILWFIAINIVSLG